MTTDRADPAIPLLRTKLHRPPVTADLVCRGRLHELLDGALAAPLALVSAPAGYGKTMLVSHWAESRQEPCVWLSLDEMDGEPIGFLRYFLAAVQTRFPEACRETATLLQATDPPPAAVLAGTLANELDAVGEPFLLVLDDYHRLGPSSGVHEVLRRVLEHPPRPLRLVVTTRHDPPLPLATLRASGQMTEVRLQDLRFTAPETAALFAATLGVAVSDQALANVQQQVEGWAVGLRLAALASRRAEDPDAFLRQLSGGVQNAQQYLVHEVVDRQPPELREWMLRTSVLDRFCAELCDAVCRPPDPLPTPSLDGKAFTQALRESNLFCISLDVQGEWFRYHHLFQDLLRVELGRRHGSQEVAVLHTRASRWFEGQVLVDEAIRHAMAAGDAERAARLVDQNRWSVLDADRGYVLERWMSRLPAAEIRRRPALLLARAWTLFFRLSYETVPPLLDEVEALLGPDPADQALAGEVSFFRGYFCLFAGQGSRSVEHVERAIGSIPVSHHELRGECEVHLALARQMDGRQEAARQALEDLLVEPVSLHPIRRTRVVAARVFVDLIAGDLTPASDMARLLQQVAEESDYPYALAWSSYLQGLVHFYRHQLPAAESCLGQAVEQRHDLHRRAAADAMAGLALTREALGRPSEADAALELLLDYFRAHADPESLVIAESCRRRLAVLRGGPEAGLFRPAESPAEVMLWWIEIPAVTRGRGLFAAGSAAGLEEAARELQGCLELNRGHHNVRQEIEILPLLALVRQQQGRAGDALALVERAVTLAAPGGWVRPFVEPGPAVAELLRQLEPRTAAADFVRRILASSEGAGAAAATPEPDVRGAPAPPAVQPPALDELTHRERDVLERLAERLSNKEIAAALGVSPATVKSHLKNLFQKLQVGNRRQAVAAAEALGLLARR